VRWPVRQWDLLKNVALIKSSSGHFSATYFASSFCILDEG
jgi:hypothetical protein